MLQRDPFESRESIDRMELEDIYATLDFYTSPSIFSGRICGISPALLLWAVNALCFVVHTAMGIAVLVQGAKGGDLLSIQTTTVVGIWRSRSANGYDFEIKDAELDIRLDYVCSTFAFISAFSHLIICCFSRFSVNERHAKFNMKFYYFQLYDCLVAWCARV